MNILVINGSPKAGRSNSYQLTKAFVDGIQTSLISEGKMKPDICELTVSQLMIRPCLGCFSCWNKTPGQCCIQDDMRMVIDRQLWADMIIWSFPLYYFSVPGSLKNLMDRQLPMVLPFMCDREDNVGNGSHPMRYDMSEKKIVVISTCGFYTAEGNYDGVCSLFDHMYGRGCYESIFCGQGELYRVPELSGRTSEYLGYVKAAGQEYLNGGISTATRQHLNELLYPKEVFEGLADASWGIDKESGEKEDESLIFTRQMATLYKKGSCKGQRKVLDMYYTDLDKHYQIIMDAEGSRVLSEEKDFVDYTTRIETPYTVWVAIARGEMAGDAALMQQLYKVKGDFQLMIDWDDYFGAAGAAGKNDKPVQKNDTVSDIHMPTRKTNMCMMLIPWIVFWVAAPIDQHIGSVISIIICSVIPVVFYKHRKTIYDAVSGLMVTVFAVSLLVGADVRPVTTIAYLAFGVMWTFSGVCRIPLTAHYSMNDYHGETALQNPLFVKTNRILTLAWGILYILTAGWTYVLLGTFIGSWIGAVNSIIPAFMGIFTAWFQKWYPAKVARG